MGGLAHLGALVNLEWLRLGVTVISDKTTRPWKRVPREELEQKVWALIKANAQGGAKPAASGEVGTEPAENAGNAGNAESARAGWLYRLGTRQ